MTGTAAWTKTSEKEVIIDFDSRCSSLSERHVVWKHHTRKHLVEWNPKHEYYIALDTKY